MAETVEELTVNYEEEGVLLCKEIEKHVLTKGAWATIMFLYQDYNRRDEEYGSLKVTIRRYQKRSGTYISRSKFNISNMIQAQKIVETLQGWMPDEE